MTDTPKALLEFAISLKANPTDAWRLHTYIAAALPFGYEQANRSAANVMLLVFDVDTSKFPEYQAMESIWSQYTEYKPEPLVGLE